MPNKDIVATPVCAAGAIPAVIALYYHKGFMILPLCWANCWNLNLESILCRSATFQFSNRTIQPSLHLLGISNNIQSSYPFPLDLQFVATTLYRSHLILYTSPHSPHSPHSYHIYIIITEPIRHGFLQVFL